jgi:hypothetical protein
VNTLPTDLTEYAARLLVGTALTPDTAALTASGARPATEPVAEALRHGWVTVELLPPRPSPVTADGDDADGRAR